MLAEQDAVMLACAEALARWRRPSASPWALVGCGAIRLALGGPLGAPVLDVVVARPVDVEEVIGHLHVVAAARVLSRLGSHLEMTPLTSDVVTLRLVAADAGVRIDLRFPRLADEEALSARQRWPMARLQSASWPGWQVATLVASPRILLGDALRRAAAADDGGAQDVQWLTERGVVVADADALAGLGGRAAPEGIGDVREWMSAFGVTADVHGKTGASTGVTLG